MEKFIKLEEKLEHHGHIIDYYTYQMMVPNGNVVEWDIIRHKGAAAIVPIDSEGKVIMVRQYRGAIDDFLLEIPAGGRDSEDEDFFVCASRELEEEIGYRSDDIHHLVDYHTAAAYTSEKIEIFYAENLIPSTQQLDENEFIQIERYTVDELVWMIAAGDITDGKSIAGIMAYKLLRDTK